MEAENIELNPLDNGLFDIGGEEEETSFTIPTQNSEYVFDHTELADKIEENPYYEPTTAGKAFYIDQSVAFETEVLFGESYNSFSPYHLFLSKVTRKWVPFYCAGLIIYKTGTVKRSFNPTPNEALKIFMGQL